MTKLNGEASVLQLLQEMTVREKIEDMKEVIELGVKK